MIYTCWAIPCTADAGQYDGTNGPELRRLGDGVMPGPPGEPLPVVTIDGLALCRVGWWVMRLHGDDGLMVLSPQVFARRFTRG